MNQNPCSGKSLGSSQDNLHLSILLVTGGSRSGKSSYAAERGLSLAGPRAFVATCPIIDDEIAARINAHRIARAGQGWQTIEETVAIAEVLRQEVKYQVVLIDCLTLWINNLLYQATQDNRTLNEDDIVAHCNELLSACADRPGTVIFVTNEVGLGLVPADPISRRYRDLVGRCNQEIAARAGEVVLMTAGIPLTLKREGKNLC
ncbi:MAG: bifunctional adenosylcobinamide kinase/adenosylcobinamide-phosphate guanylyltransferase [Myxococcota bacterium]|nr:bifunctional adenosylcobinamide kinase/adenosylcobinamide-phosphate guanylyltransferase [Myxococcota bacterium]